MIELEQPMQRLRQAQYEHDLRVKSLEALEDVALWQLRLQYKALQDEVERYNLVKAGFQVDETKEYTKLLAQLLKAKVVKKRGDNDDDDDEAEEDSDLTILITTIILVMMTKFILTNRPKVVVMDRQGNGANDNANLGSYLESYEDGQYSNQFGDSLRDLYLGQSGAENVGTYLEGLSNSDYESALNNVFLRANDPQADLRAEIIEQLRQEAGDLLRGAILMGGVAAGEALAWTLGARVGAGAGLTSRPAAEMISQEAISSQIANLNRFNSKVPIKAGSTRVTEYLNGNKLFSTDVPANNIPGSFARYEKLIDSYGKTVTYTKTTYAPNGSIVHIKLK